MVAVEGSSKHIAAVAMYLGVFMESLSLKWSGFWGSEYTPGPSRIQLRQVEPRICLSHVVRERGPDV
jgi:hypothetical protein